MERSFCSDKVPVSSKIRGFGSVLEIISLIFFRVDWRIPELAKSETLTLMSSDWSLKRNRPGD